MQQCNKCLCHKPLDEFYLDKRRGRHRTTCIACCKTNKGPNSGKRTPEQRAAYARGKEGRTCEYIPQTIRLDRAAEKRAANQDAHVRAWERNHEQQAKTFSHDEHVVRWRCHSKALRYFQNYRIDPEFRSMEQQRQSVRRTQHKYPRLAYELRRAVVQNERYRLIEELCDYTVADLRMHLESRFTPGMTWEAFERGEIHLDHRIPVAAFDMRDETEIGMCWRLENIQPLWARDNIVKSDRLPDGRTVRGINRGRVPLQHF